MWPLFRIGGLIMSAPLFGSRPVPSRIRLGFALAITFVVVPVVSPAVPSVDALSYGCIDRYTTGFNRGADGVCTAVGH